MRYPFKTILSMIFLALVLSSCGSNGSQKSNNIQSEPYYKYAWHFNPNTQIKDYFNINENAHINIEKTWDITQGQGVKVAVIDDSFDMINEDYRQNIYSTCDMSYFEGGDILKYCTFNTNVHPQWNEESHGTSVASFISSAVNNEGLVGSAPKSKLILITVSKYATIGQYIAAFEYAKQMNAKVINCSWGSGNVDENLASKLEELKQDGINIVFASGNGDENGMAINLDNSINDVSINDESELDSVIGVGATNEQNDVASYSNYGKNIDVLAPGGDSLGVLAAFKSNSSYPNDAGLNIKPNYSFMQGTSFSAPITSGVIALMLSVNPNLSPDEIRNILIKTTDKIGLENGANYINGFDKKRAYGKINAHKAVIKARNYRK